jgi:putative transposase
VRTNRPQQSLSYPIRLSDEAQPDALRLLDLSRQVINLALVALWPKLDEFGTRTEGPAYKQVEAMIGSPVPHGHRQWRCVAEQVGRILRGQAEPLPICEREIRMAAKWLNCKA